VRIIAGQWKGRRLKPLKGKSVRPTTDRVREAWMSALGGSFEGRTVFDLFAGSGALGLETLSRGAEHVVFVERARGASSVLRANIELLGAGHRCTVLEDDVFRFIASETDFVDVALADPPYGVGNAARLVSCFVESPFASELWVEHLWREELAAPSSVRTRRYGDTAITTLTAES
jgi:16S rRNA (guanine966-N2)-methyltransferase